MVEFIDLRNGKIFAEPFNFDAEPLEASKLHEGLLLIHG